jgi:hypothetical protein
MNFHSLLVTLPIARIAPMIQGCDFEIEYSLKMEKHNKKEIQTRTYSLLLPPLPSFRSFDSVAIHRNLVGECLMVLPGVKFPSQMVRALTRLL